MKPRQVVVVAMPDQLHYPVIMEALKYNQHILCVKPLVLEYAQTVEIEKIALEKGLFVGVEYHKRFDRRALMARRSYEQNLEMFFEGDGKTGMIKHNDQNRGFEHAYLEGIGCAGSHFNYVSPDFYRLIPWEGEGYKPTGYGYESVEATIKMAHIIENEVKDMSAAESLTHKRMLIRKVDEKGIIATPANSFSNELVVEAARLSILNDGDWVSIEYGTNPKVTLRS